MDWFAVFSSLVLIVAFMYADYYLISGKNFYGSITCKLVLKIGCVFVNSLLLIFFLWCFATFALKFTRWVVICATRGWVRMNSRLERYIPNFLLPSVFNRTGQTAVPTQGYPVPPAAYGDSSNAPPPIIPVGNPSRVFHHHVHQLVATHNVPNNQNTPRRRIPRLPACTLRSSRSAASSAAQRILILENLAEQMRHVYPPQPPPASAQQDEPIQAPGDSSSSAPEPPISPSASQDDHDVPLGTENKFTPVVRAESVTDVPASDDNTLVLHQFPRSLTKPCLFCSGLYLETYIRLIEISCDVVFDCFDLNGPWISYKKQKVFGLTKCLEFLKVHFNDKAMVFSLSEYGERSAAAWSLSILIDHLCCVMECWRWKYEAQMEFAMKQPRWAKIYDQSTSSISDLSASFNLRGFNELSPVQIAGLISKDLSSLSIAIQNGGNSFLLGPSPTEIDCQAFAVLSQMVWGNDRCLRSKISREYLPVERYCTRLKNMLWPDWNEQSAKTLQENSTSHICKIFNNASNSNCCLDRFDDSDKLLDGQEQDSILASPANRNFRSSYYQITPTRGISESAVAAQTQREPYSISEYDEEEEAEVLYVGNTAPVRSGMNLDDRQAPRDDGPHKYGIVHEDDNDQDSQDGLLYTTQEEYFDDNLQDMNNDNN